MRVACAVLLLVLVGCDQDPFHQRERAILADYELAQSEDSSLFYLVREGAQDNGGGVLDGTVVRIGWNGHYILAERKANFRGDKDGWMIIDTSTNRTTGPFTDAELKAHPETQDMAVMSAPEAWKRLH